jgi:hypothetical protein
MIQGKVCRVCGKPPEDTPEKMLFVIVDERRIPVPMCNKDLKERLDKQ